MTEKTLTTENIRPALDALRGELAPWPVVAKKQDRLNTAQLNAANSGITSSLVAQIIANTAAIRALESAITGTGLRALVVATLPAVGTTGILYIVPVTTYDPETDADVVNYSNEYIWIPVEGGTASEGHYEQVGQTGIVINNGQLTITVNGTSVGTFTANQSGDTTAAITVPTNADYVDRTTDQTVAGVKTFSSTINGTASKAIADEDGTSIKSGYVNVAGTQTVSGQKTWSGNQFFTSPMYPKNTSYEIGNTPASNVAIPIYFTDKNNVYTGYVRNAILTTGRTQSELIARNKFTSGALSPTGTDVTSTLQVEVQSNGDKTLYFDGAIRNNVLPYTTNTYALGSSSYQWSSVYAQTYYYNGTQWGLDQANTWTGSNTYAKTVTLYNSDNTQSIPALYLRNSKAELSSSGNTSSYQDISFRDKNDTIYAYIRSGLQSNGSIINLKTFAKDSNNNSIENTLQIVSFINGTKALLPVNSGTDLGNSTYKWKTLNGINPGALSLPDKDNRVDITSEFTDLTGGDIFYIPPADGWITITADNEIYCAVVSTTHRTTFWSQSASATSISTASVTIPVRYTQHFLAKIKSTNAITVTFYPCLGNV